MIINMHLDFIDAGSYLIVTSYISVRKRRLLEYNQLDFFEQATNDSAMLANKAKNISELAPTPVRLAKKMMKEHFIDQLIEVNQKEFDSFIERMKSPEALEAMQAFMQKREPDFSKFD